MTQMSTWIRAAHCNDIPLREGRAVKVAGRDVAIFNLGNRFLAVMNHCPHKGGPLADGIVSGAAVVCPLHAWKFNLENGRGVNGASAASCAETFRTRVEGGVVWLEIALDVSSAEEANCEDLPGISFDSARESGASESICRGH